MISRTYHHDASPLRTIRWMLRRPLRPFRLRVPLFYAHKNKSTHFHRCFHFGTPLGTYTNADAFAVLAAAQLEHFAGEPSAGCFAGRSGPFGFESFDFYACNKKVLLTKNFFIGAPLGTRTPNLRILSALLYPIELIALIQFTTLIIIH